MIKNTFILKSTSLLLSFWMLLASTGLSIDFHYCEGELVDWSIFSGEPECNHEEEIAVESCCESAHAMQCDDSLESHIEKSNCCSSDEACFEINTNFNVTQSEVEYLSPQLIVLSQLIVPSLCFEQHGFVGVLKQEVPILYTQEHSFIQSFLI